MARGKATVLAVTILALLCGAPAPRAMDLRNVLNGYSITTWGSNDGLPSSEVLAIAQDADGFLWLGTDSGLVRFDGTRFSVIDGPASGRSVRALHITGSGDVWVGLGEHGGVLHYARAEPGELQLRTAYDAESGLAAGAIRSVLVDRAGAVWAGHLGGLFRLDGGRWTRTGGTHLDDAEIHSLALDADGRLLAGTDRGVVRHTSPGAFVHVDAAGEREDPVAAITVDAAGHVWRTDRVHGVRTQTARRDVVPLEIARGNRLLHDRSGHVWVGTGGQGLWRVTARGDRLQVEQTTVTTGLLGNGIVSLFEDRDGNIWAGTLDGLNRLTRYVATPLQDLGLVSGVEATSAGLWVLTADALKLFPSGNPTDTPRIVFPGTATAIHGDEADRLWMAVDGRLSWFDRSGRHELPMGTSQLRSVALIASDRAGGLWLYDTAEGLHRLARRGAAPQRVPAPIGRARLTWMETTAGGSLWLAATDGRVARIAPDGSVVEHSETSKLGGGAIRAWHVEADGTVWLGGEAGLVRLQDGVFTPLFEAHGRRLEQITGIVADAGDRLWIGMRSGVLRVEVADLHRRISAAADAVPLTQLTKAEGLAGNPRWYGHRGAVRDASNRLWFVTSRGVSIIDPDAIAAPRSVRARVDTVVVDGHQARDGGLERLSAGTRRLDIQFAALALTAPSAIRFRYRLDGFDSDWVDAGTRRNASYTNLPPGAYRFRVMATNTDGTWPERAAVWSFSVAPMFYQTPWFAAFCVALLLGSVGVGWRLHLRRMRAETSILLAERARVAREIHDTLLQGLFGVALRCEALAGELERTSPQASAQLIDLRRGVEQYVREARQSILGLRSPALERLGLSTALRTSGEQLTAGTRVRFLFESSGSAGSCRPDYEEHLLRIGQEAISNAVRHAGANIIRVGLHYSTAAIALQVTDDGGGVDLMRASNGGGLGLAGMEERARAAGGSLSVRSRDGRGTTIEVRVPYGPSDAAA